MSSAPSSTSSARPRPIRRGSRAIGPPPGTKPAPTSHCDSTAFSRLAKRMSLASASSLPTPVARPRIEAIETTGARLSRTSMSGSCCSPVGPAGSRVVSSSLGDQVVVGQEESVDGAVEDHDLDVVVLLQRRDDLVELRDGLRAEDVERRMVERHPPVRRRPPGEKDLVGGHRWSHGSFPSLINWGVEGFSVPAGVR